MSVPSPFAIFAFTFAVVMPLISSAQESELDGNQFRANYAVSLRRLAALAENIEVSGQHDRAGISSRVVILVLHGSLQSWTFYPEDRSGIPEIASYPDVIVRSRSSEESFKLGDNDQKHRFYVMGLGNQVSGEIDSHFQKLLRPSCFAATHVPMYELAELMQDRKVVTVSAEEVLERPGTTKLALDWASRGEYLERGEFWIYKHPCGEYLLESYDLYGKPVDGVGEILKGSVTYGDSSYPCLPMKVRIESHVTGRESELFLNWTVDSLKVGTVRSEIFSLEYFGLGTKAMESNKRIPWLTLVSGIVFLASIVAIKLLRKSR